MAFLGLLCTLRRSCAATVRAPSLSLALVAVASAASAADRVLFSQRVELRKGWNAFCLTVAPQGSADDFFAEWPVDFVAAYDQAAFLETKQYSSSASSEGLQKSAYRIWHRGDRGSTSLQAPVANTVYLCYATNAMPARTVYGVPCAPRVTWHPSAQSGADDGTMNLVGVSASGETTISAYFEGLDVGNSTCRQFFGLDAAAPKQVVLGGGAKVSSGEALIMDATKVGDWSGVLNVSPVAGVDFGSDASSGLVQVRNDGTKARTVRVSLSAGSAANAQDVPPVPPGLMAKDSSTALSAAEAWRDFTPSAPFEKRLEAGETLKLSVALDRTRLASAGTYYGALLVISDVDGGSGMRVVIPVEATSDGGASAATAWPTGIWIASAELDKVSFVGGEVEVTNSVEEIDKETGVTNVVESVETVKGIYDVAAGGKMKVRLPLVVDREGNMALLQRFWYGRDSSNALHVISGSQPSDVALSSPRRVSTAFLPTDQVRIAAADGVFGRSATFPFVVSETSGVNPMRHALHPQHDGKRFDFATPSPSGDDFANYSGTVKPESFSISNTVYFSWSETSGTAWQPEETLRGDLVWEFGGLRHEGTVRARGPFVMKRISSATPEK